MSKLANLLLIAFLLALVVVLALSALAASGAALASAVSVSGLVCLAGMMGVFGLLAGLALGGTAGYVAALRRSGASELPEQQRITQLAQAPRPTLVAPPAALALLGSLASVYQVTPVREDERG